MGKFTSSDMIGLRNKETKKLLATYPFKAEGTDAEIEKKVKDWYYMQNCSAEEIMRNAYVDILTDAEVKSHK